VFLSYHGFTAGKYAAGKWLVDFAYLIRGSAMF